MRLTVTEPGKELHVQVAGAGTDSLVLDITAQDPLRTAFGAWSNRAAVTGDWWVDAQSLEADIGRPLGLYRAFATGASPVSQRVREVVNGGHPLLLNWKPASTWPAAAQADLGPAAADLAALGRPLMLTVWHEPENDLSATNTVAAYHAMWANVGRHLGEAGAWNVDLVFTGINALNSRSLTEQLFPEQAELAAYDPYVPNADVDVLDHFAEKYLWWDNPARPWAGRPYGWSEWGIGLNPYTPSVERQTRAFNDLSEAFSGSWFPKLEYIAYFDSRYAQIQREALPAFAELSHLPRFN